MLTKANLKPRISLMLPMLTDRKLGLKSKTLSLILLNSQLKPPILLDTKQLWEVCPKLGITIISKHL